jgi:hypothetical protein
MADGFAQLDGMIARLRALPGLAERAAPAVADAVREELQRTISAGTSADGETWAPKKDGGKPLQDAEAALTVVPVGKRIIIKLRGPEARHHRGWARGGVRRPIIPVNKIPAAMAHRIKKVLAAEFAKVVSHG